MALDDSVTALLRQLRDQGNTWRAIAAELNERGLTTQRGQAWTEASAHKAAIRHIVTEARPTKTPQAKPRAVHTSFNRTGGPLSGARTAAIHSRWASVEEVAALLGVEPSEVWVRALRGEIPSNFIGAGNGQRAFLRTDIERLIAENGVDTDDEIEEAS